MSMIESICQQAKSASRLLALTSTADKNAALQRIADQVWSERGTILEANAADYTAAQKNGLTPAMLDRLMLNEARISAIVADLRHVADLPDPVGEVFERRDLPNGLHLRKQRVPLGVLAVIYEARPMSRWMWPDWRLNPAIASFYAAGVKRSIPTGRLQKRFNGH
jgi:glutamate-5-semialdehyde dehydrogenase